jgi:hypothetical protein
MISQIVAGAINIGTGKPGSRRYLRSALGSAYAAGAPPMSPRGADSAGVIFVKLSSVVTSRLYAKTPPP